MSARAWVRCVACPPEQRRRVRTWCDHDGSNSFASPELHQRHPDSEPRAGSTTCLPPMQSPASWSLALSGVSLRTRPLWQQESQIGFQRVNQKEKLIGDEWASRSVRSQRWYWTYGKGTCAAEYFQWRNDGFVVQSQYHLLRLSSKPFSYLHKSTYHIITMSKWSASWRSPKMGFEENFRKKAVIITGKNRPESKMNRFSLCFWLTNCTFYFSIGPSCHYFFLQPQLLLRHIH